MQWPSFKSLHRFLPGVLSGFSLPKALTAKAAEDSGWARRQPADKFKLHSYRLGRAFGSAEVVVLRANLML
jgi:hypothetical protein